MAIESVMIILLVVLIFLVSIPVGTVGAQHSKQTKIMITLGSSLSPNNTRLPNSWLSPSGLFAFGFYPQGDGFAVGIWLATKPDITVVWTANRDDPPVSSNTTLEFTKYSGLLLRSEQGRVNVTNIVQNAAVSASLLDSGNFRIYDKESLVIWESFDYPTDTILGGQNLTSFISLLSSVSTSDHSSGRFRLDMQSDGNLVAYPVNSYRRSEDSYWSTQTYSTDARLLNLNSRGLICLRNASGFIVYTVANSTISGENKTIIYRVTLDSDGNFRLYSHTFEMNDKSTVSIEWWALQNLCEIKGICGVNSYCSGTGNTTNCVCFPGFLFLDPKMAFRGCYRSFIDEEDCRKKDPTLLSYNITAFENMGWGGDPYFVRETDKADCRHSCLQDCHCWAALYMNGTCNKYKLPLIYAVQNQNKSATAFIKKSFEIAQIPGPHQNPVPILKPKIVVESKKTLVSILAISLGSLAFICSLIAIYSFFIYRCRVHRYQKLSKNSNGGLNVDFTLRSFSYSELDKATDGFTEELGRSSFGAVYKGVICEDKKIVAVKRLERVAEGERKFRAEMSTIARTHHRNLVRLLGFCVEGDRKLLVYEFMNNGSLADLLFKVGRRPSWKERVRIALDVAKGILYLHEECEARIIHCNIKPQNILMDDCWTAKISDFGLAKLLTPVQTETVSGVRGRRGFLAPEWHRNTMISEKVDVYSYGVVLLEIICCRSNLEFNVSTADEVLLSTWVYNCFMAKELEKLIGDEKVDIKTLDRMVKVGLLCLQDDPNLRPSMKNVILMLEGTMDIPSLHLQLLL